jgi:hypothetical protein
MSSSGRNGVEERQRPLCPAGSAEPAVGVYSEDEEDVTRCVETPRPEPKWLVQITPFDRRQMSTEALLRELRRGQLVHRESLVWRGGTASWRPIANVDELQLDAPARSASPGQSVRGQSVRGQSVRGQRARRQQPGRLPLLVAAGAAALLAGALTVYGLARAGAFEPGGHRKPSAVAGMASP